MTAASAYPPEPTLSRSSEPSMEDILASIRRIIADDQNGAGQPAAGANEARRPAPPASGDAERAVVRARTPYDDVLDLARLVPPTAGAVAEQPRAATAPARQDAVGTADRRGSQDLDQHQASGLRARLPEPAAKADVSDEDERSFDHKVSPVNDDVDEDLLSPPLGASVLSAFETLAATVVLQNTPMLERLMRDLLRPMLKTWLDDNLPGLVEKLVRTEIERVARGSRG